MKICGHIFNQSEVVGIGPLMVEYTKDLTMRQLYSTRRLCFELHLKNHTTLIKSDFVDISGISDEQKTKNVKYLEDFKKDYETAKDAIVSMIA